MARNPSTIATGYLSDAALAARFWTAVVFTICLLEK